MILIQSKKLSSPEKWLIFSIPILFIIGSMLHFIYDLTGQIKLIGLFAPVNESIWEHLKMLLLPIICWWCFYYIINGKKYNINKEKWLFGTVISVITSMLTMLAFYYTYTQALGIESLALDIFDLFLSIAVGQGIGLHVYKYGKGIDVQTSFFLIILLIVLFALFTFYPPHLPIFKDNLSGTFGI